MERDIKSKYFHEGKEVSPDELTTRELKKEQEKISLLLIQRMQKENRKPESKTYQGFGSASIL